MKSALDVDEVVTRSHPPQPQKLQMVVFFHTRSSIPHRLKLQSHHWRKQLQMAVFFLLAELTSHDDAVAQTLTTAVASAAPTRSPEATTIFASPPPCPPEATSGGGMTWRCAQAAPR
jgi:hypothetical protein